MSRCAVCYDDLMIPTIDLQSENLSTVDGALAGACATWGFFFLVGHNVARELQQEAIHLTQAFFRKSAAEKNEIRRTQQNSWGYFDAELTKNRPDWKEILDIGPTTTSGPLAGSHPQWPNDTPFIETITSLQSELHRVAMATMAAIVKTFHADTVPIRDFTEHSSFIRLNHYPPCPDPVIDNDCFVSDRGHLGIGHHTDAGAVTVLLQDDQPGLQVFTNGRWLTLKCPPDALIINIGDVVQVWSNDRYRAPVHRVVADRVKHRISIPYFLNPAYHANYAPLTAEKPRYRAINWGHFRARRSAGDYADLGSEIQISDYRVVETD